LVVLFLLLALLLGGVGLFATDLTWPLIIALAVFAASPFSAWYHYGHRQFQDVSAGGAPGKDRETMKRSKDEPACRAGRSRARG
jgi:hypothetical protein